MRQVGEKGTENKGIPAQWNKEFSKIFTEWL